MTDATASLIKPGEGAKVLYLNIERIGVAPDRSFDAFGSQRRRVAFHLNKDEAAPLALLTIEIEHSVRSSTGTSKRVENNAFLVSSVRLI